MIRSLIVFGAAFFAGVAHAETILNYDFNGDLTDSSGNGQHATTVLGTVTYTAGIDGQAAVFNGSTVIAMPNDTIRNNPDFTLSLRFKTTASNMPIVGYQNAPFAQPNTAANYIPIVGILPSGELKVTLWAGSSAFSVQSAAAVNDDVWHRVDVVADTTNGSLEAFLDGSSIGQQASSVDHIDMSFNYLGGSRSQNYFAVDTYTGALDLLSLSNDAQVPPPPPPVPQVQATPVPTMPGLGLLGLGLMMGLVGRARIKRRGA